MTTLKVRIDATNERLKLLKETRKVENKTRQKAYKQSRADQERKKVLVGEAVLRRLDNGEWDEDDFLQMMDDYVSRPVDRELFGLHE
jgi:hypothetical protein